MIYHYTKDLHIENILKQGIKKTRKFIDNKEKPVVWLSTNNVWENTVAEEKLEDIDYFVPVRILINPKNLNLKPWSYHKNFGGISSIMAKKLEVVGIRNGSKPYEWLVCYKEIPVANFESIEIWKNKWIPL